MKIQVKDIQPNPFRNMAKYPVNQAKVDKLKNSINQTGFWDNIFVRPLPDTDQYQLAYGHHRLAALKEIGIKEIDIPVKEVDDAVMIQMMINENMSDWAADTVTINESVRAAKVFLDRELGKYKNWDEFRSGSNTLPISSEPEFRNIKSKGIGHNTLQKFMGSNWKEWMIKEGLRNLKEEDILEAVETIKSPTLSGGFRDALRKIENEMKAELPEPEEEETMDMYIDEILGSEETDEPEVKGQQPVVKQAPVYQQPKPVTRVISPERVKEVAQRIQERLEKNEDVPKYFKKPEDKMEVMIKQELQGKSEYDVALENIRRDLLSISTNARHLNNTIRVLNGRFDKLNLEELKTLESIPLAETLIDLQEAIQVLAKKLGFNNSL